MERDCSNMKVKKSNSDKALVAFAYFIIGFIGLACILPLIMTVSVSFSTEATIIRNGYSLLPQDFTLNTYQYIFGHSGVDLLRSYGVTISIAVIGTAIALLITSMMAFALSVDDMKYRNVFAFIADFTIIFSSGLSPWYYACVNY